MTEELESLTCKELITKLYDLFESQNEEEVDECLDWFLFTYSPEHAFSLVQSNADALKDPMLLTIVMTKVKEIYEPEIFLETMNVISSIEGHEQEIARSGACRAVITMMGRDAHNARSQSLGCKVLANLAHDVEVCEWLGKIKAVVRIIDALRRHQTSLDVSIECLRCLANLAYRCKPNKDIMVMEHGIDAIADTMGMHKSNVKLVNSALRALRNIVTLDSVLELQQHTLIHDVISCMQDHSAISEIQVHGIWTLIGLMSGKAEVKRHMADQTTLEPILRAMEIHKVDAQVQLAGATAIALLSKVNEHRALIAKGKVNPGSSQTGNSTTSVSGPSSGSTGITGLRVLLNAMQNHRDSVPVQRAVVKAFFRLSFNKTIREQLVQYSIVTEVVESMKANPEHTALQRNSIICLLQFAKTPALRECVQRDAVSYIIQVRNKFTGVPHVHNIAHTAVESMVSNASVSPLPTLDVSYPESAGGIPLSPRRGMGGDDGSDSSELKTLRTALKEKEKQAETLEATVARLEALLTQLKADRAKKSDKQPLADATKNAANSQNNDKLIQLRQQAETLSAELKQAKMANMVIKTKLKDEDDKLAQLKAKKKQMSEEKKSLRSSEDDSFGDSSESSVDPEAEKGHKKTKSTGSAKGLKKKDSKSPRSSSSLSSEESEIVVTDADGNPITLTPSTPPKSSTNSTARGLKRNTPSRANLNSTDEIAALKVDLEELLQQMEQKEKDLESSREDKNKCEQQVSKLNVELKGAHVLVQTLQKESISQNAARDKATAGNSSMWSRQQKKMKDMRDKQTLLETENEELRKEVSSLKAKKKRK